MNEIKFTVNGEVYELNPQKMTFAEARVFEATSGVSFLDMADDPRLAAGPSAMQALAWIAVKRKEPTTRFADLDDVEMMASLAGNMESAEDEGEGEGEADPTPETSEDDEPRHAAIAAVS